MKSEQDSELTSCGTDNTIDGEIFSPTHSPEKLLPFHPLTMESNNFRWLSTAKEVKILFFVLDINGEKFLPAHATREIFLSYLSPRLRGFPPFVVLSPAWSKLLFPLEHFSHPPFPVHSLRPVSIVRSVSRGLF